MTLDSLVEDIKGVGAGAATRLAVLGIHSVADLIENYPRRYNDFSTIAPIAKLRPGSVTIKAEIKQINGRYVRRGMHITEAAASDKTGSVRLIWFNQPYRTGSVVTSRPYYISGQYELGRGRFAIMNPSAELVSDFPINTARIVPVYRETKGLTTNQLRRFMREILPVIRDLPETLPAWLVSQEKLMSRAEALEMIHFPKNSSVLEQAKERLGFEEVFALSLAGQLNKQELLHDVSLAVPFNETLAKQFVGHLAFKLTDDQRKATWQIYKDMQHTQPMNRLIEGDVGSGKTVVAAMASLMAIAAGYQVALMAPTEILARQHLETICSLFKPIGLESAVGLLVGSHTSKTKAAIVQRIGSGEIKLIVGTHALIQEGVDMKRLGLVIIDEQHRFGVEQRQKLMAKAGHMPHLLSLTATPIPRSLALTLYGELNISIINMRPASRQPVMTAIYSPNSRVQVYARAEQELATGRQMFVVCPLITASVTVPSDVSAETVYDRLRQHEFKHRRIGLLHGRMKSADKQAVMKRFAKHEIDILVTTTVIEVGIDVPNATVMIVEAADRFGLAQIHQLRGRVGRGTDPGYCYLIMSDMSALSPRLKILERSNDGFKLAEIDLKLRGPGAIYGTAQHGQLDLRIAELTDVKLIIRAKAAAQMYIDRRENLLQYPVTYQRVQRFRAVTNLN
jgi:ATP-dependent DNA helicase RecG